MACLNRPLAFVLATVPIFLALVCATWPGPGPGEWESTIFDDPALPGLELIQKSAKVLHAKLGKTVLASEERADTKSLIAEATTASGFDGPGGLKIFFIGISVDAAFVICCLIIWRAGNNRYKIIYRDNITKGYTEHFHGTVLDKWASDEDQPMQTTWFGWARASWALKLEDVWEAAGFDHAMLLEFVNICYYSMKYIAVPIFFSVGLLYWLCGGNAAGPRREMWFSVENVKFGSNLYYVTAIVAWYVAIIITRQVDQGMQKFVPLRMKWLSLWDKRRGCTLLMLGIPEAYRSDEKCRRFWETLFPNGRVRAVSVTKDTSKVHAAWSHKNALEDQLRSHMPNDETMVREQEELNIAADKYQGAVADLRAENDIGEGFVSNGFVTFDTRQDAEIALRLDLSADPNEWVLHPAPVPSDVSWADLSQEPFTGACGYTLTFFLVLLYMPLVVGICNIAKVIHLGPLQSVWASEAPSLGLTIIIGFLPSLLAMIFRNFHTVYSQTQAQYKLSVWYWWLSVFLIVIVNALGTSYIPFVDAAMKDPSKILTILGDTMPGCTYFYMNFFGVQWYFIAGVLTRYVPLMRYRTLLNLYANQQEAKQMAEPEDQDCHGIGARTARVSTYMCIGIVFGTLSPPCLLLCFITMIGVRFVFGYNITFAETRKTDMGGIFFVRGLQNLYWSLHLYFIVMIGVLTQRTTFPHLPAGITSYAWCYVIYMDVKFRSYKWERLTYPVLQNVEDDPEKMTQMDWPHLQRPTDGNYIQPELDFQNFFISFSKK